MLTRFTIADLMLVTGFTAIVFGLWRVMPDFYTTWIMLGLWFLLLRHQSLSLFSLQVMAMVVSMIWRLDFGRRADSFSGPWFAEEGAAFGLIASLIILGSSSLYSRYRARLA